MRRCVGALPLGLALLVTACSGATPAASRSALPTSPAGGGTPATSGGAAGVGTPAAGGTATAPTSTSTPTATPSQNSAATGTPACGRANAHVSLGQGQGTAGSEHQPLVVTVSTRCELHGFPVVTVLSSAGRQIAGPAATNGASDRLVVPAGSRAYALLDVADAGAFPTAQCRPEQGAFVSVTLPGDRNPTRLTDALQVCTGGEARQLQVEAFRPGNGG